MDTSENKVAYDIANGNAWRVKATYGEKPGDAALIEFFHDGQPFQSFEYPAYKIWNIAAHFDDIVEDFAEGMAVASSTGLEGLVQ